MICAWLTSKKCDLYFLFISIAEYDNRNVHGFNMLKNESYYMVSQSMIFGINLINLSYSNKLAKAY
jgi:hypothetical protein